MKKYLNEIKNKDQIIVFDTLGDFLSEDENGQYFKDNEEFDWWNKLANAIEKIEDYKNGLTGEELEDFEEELNERVNELEDYIFIAKRL